MVLSGVLFVAPPALFADPAKATQIAGLGAVIDPSSDCKIEGNAQLLTIAIPGSDHALAAEQDRMNAPRILQEISGDFSAEVKVWGTYPTEISTVVPGRVPFQGAGLLLWVDSGTYIRLERAQIRIGEEHGVYPSWELRLAGKPLRMGTSGEGALSGTSATVRIIRTGNKVTGAVSEDGKEWTQLDPLIVKLPEKVQIGVVAGHNTMTPFEATFEKFTLTPAEKAKE